MKIAVCAKQIPDPANTVTYDGGTIVRPDEQVLDDTDRYGIEVALQLKEKFDAEVTVISMGKLGTQKGIQQALQMGADKALVIEDTELQNSNSLMTSNVLSGLAKIAEADIVIFGTETLFPFVIPFATKERYIAIVPFGTATECFLPTVFEIWSSRLAVILCSVIQEPLLKYFVTSSISCAVISGSL